MCVFLKSKNSKKKTQGGNYRFLAFLICLILSAGAVSGCGFRSEGQGSEGSGAESSSDGSSAERTTFQMDTLIVQQWYGKNAKNTCDKIEAELTKLENEISLYIDDSEIAKINAAAGESYVQVSDDVFNLLKESKELCEESGGDFDITIAPLVLLWDITGEDPHVPKQSEIDEALAKVDYTKLLLNEEDKSVMLADNGMKIDLGGAAKGYAASMLRDIVEKNDVSGYISLGGNMLVEGKNPDGSDFVVGIRDPNNDYNHYFATITLDGYTMATSSSTERYFEENGVIYHHILDPKTGYPGDTDLLQVSVVAKDGLLADALSTTIFLKGSECLSEYLNRDDCMVLAVTKDNKVYGSEKIWDIVTESNTQDYEFDKDFRG